MAETERIAILLQLENDNFEKKAQSAAKAVQRIEQRFDPLAKAAQRYEREQLSVNKALASGKIDAERAQKALDNLSAEYQQATGAMNSMGVAGGGLTGVIGRNKSVLQQAGYQIGDFAVQVQGGQSALIAFTQQGTQMLGVFGAYGAIAGAVLAVGAPIIASFFKTGEAADTYGDAIEDLQASLEAYQAAALMAGASSDDLAAQFGSGAEALRGQLELLRELALAKALTDAKTAAVALNDEYRSLFSNLEEVGGRGTRQTVLAAKQLQEQFGLSRAEGLLLRDALNEIGAATGPAEISRTAATLNDVLLSIYGNVQDIPLAFQDMATAAANASVKTAELDASIKEVHNSILDAAMAAYDIGAGIYSAMPSADTLLIRMREIAGAAWDAAAAFTAAQNAEAKAALATKLAPLGNDERGTQTDQVQSVGDFRSQQALGVANKRASEYLNPSAPKKAGGSKAKKAGAGKTERPFFEDVERDIVALERQIEMVGKSSAEVAELTARYTMLDEAKKRGITVTDELSTKINAESAEVGRLAAQYEAAKDKMAALEDLNTQWKDSLIDAAMGVEGAFDGVIDAIKRAAIEYAIFGTGMFAGGGAGGGGLIGAAANAFGGFRAKGGSVSGGKTYMVGEQGPELFTPPSGGKIIPNNKLGGGAATQNVTQNINVVGATGNSEIRQMVAQGVQQGNAQMRKEVPGIVSRHTKVAR